MEFQDCSIYVRQDVTVMCQDTEMQHAQMFNIGTENQYIDLHVECTLTILQNTSQQGTVSELE